MSETLTKKNVPGLKILVADDNQTMRELLCNLLSGAGYEVSAADSAEAALQLFGSHHYPLVITDIRMPGMSGIDLLQQIKKMDSETEVVIMTGHGTLDTAILALRAGAYDYLLKPFDDLELITALVNRAVEKITMNIENKLLIGKLKRKNDELEILNNTLRDLAIRDGLTGLYNHRYFQESISQEVARSRRNNRPFSLIFIDVDHFKRYNDKYGHSQGDKLLYDLGGILLACSRQSDIVARYGGEEFILVLPETTKEGALILAENIRTQVAEHVFAGKASHSSDRVTVSIGIATFPESGLDNQTLIEKADLALYSAKSAGRNKVCLFQPDMSSNDLQTPKRKVSIKTSNNKYID